MEDLEETICKLCLSSVTHKNCHIIDKHARDILGILLPKWHLDEGKHLICDDCSIKLFAAFDFKGTCVNTEDCIFPYVNFEKEGLLDLREVYLKENDWKLSISDIQNVCRLCMQLIFGEFIRLEQLDVNMLNTYIPEINFSSTKDPVICNTCYEAFKFHSVFLTICLENKNGTKYINDGSAYLKTEEIDVKNEEIGLNDEEINKRDLEEMAHKGKKIKCEISEPSTKKESSLEVVDKETLQPQPLQHKTGVNSKKDAVRCVRIYKCEKCKFQTTYSFHLNRHKLRHQDPSELQMYKCDECTYMTRDKCHLVRHKLVHTDPSKIEMFKCNECSFETRFKANLRSHKLKHRDPSEVQMYKCNECSYQTKRKLDLQKHKLRHRDPSERQLYKCEMCARSFKHKSYVWKHMMTTCPLKSNMA